MQFFKLPLFALKKRVNFEPAIFHNQSVKFTSVNAIHTTAWLTIFSERYRLETVYMQVCDVFINVPDCRVVCVMLHMASVTRKGTFGHFTWCRPRSALKTLIRNQTVHTARNISFIDVMSVNKRRPWLDAASETRRLVWVYTFCLCPKVPFRMTLAICLCKLMVYTAE